MLSGSPRFIRRRWRVYDHVRVNTVYRGGAFQGRTYVVPAGGGGYKVALRSAAITGGRFEHNDRDPANAANAAKAH